ncbi:hypothetical protein GJ688_14790 [Heliobacillus mobilis]|uniref:Cobalamin biosynthesis protein CbiG n=1 Tax=Heliobacterium mobile TaxID=28064 RepID=A0A6I3SMM2_HELMO|nr:cobalt-precorrin 5A hydrolase [Heliobacterium mobile]MTV50241.1 hypothetical protein [Heliobacterium mobile]
MNVLALTPGGADLARRIGVALPEAVLWLPAKISPTSNLESCISRADQCWQPPLRETFERLFTSGQPLVFIGALGILVRMAAPFLVDKRTDPPVVVVDEAGQFVISVLSGHWGGANDLALEISRQIGATPVITTATDVVGLPAVDTFARHIGAVPEPWSNVKKISSAMLRGAPIEWLCDHQFYDALVKQNRTYPWKLWDPAETAKRKDERETVVVSTVESALPQEEALKVLLTHRVGNDSATLRLRPRFIVAGLGCRKGVPTETVMGAIDQAFQQVGIHPDCLLSIASAWVKAEERAFLETARIRKVPFQTYKSDEIEECCTRHRDDIPGSDFVAQKIGVKAVCEPTALLAHRRARLLLKKRVLESVTVALAEVPWPLSD